MSSLLGFLIDEATKLRFWAKVQKGGEDECWPWIASCDRFGYGQFKIGGKKGAVVGTHRFVAAISYDPFDESAHYLHSCDNRRCCNPNHVSPGTHQDNMEDMARKGRNRTPRPGNGRPKLDDEQRHRIVEMFSDGNSKSLIARMFGVSPTRIRQIIKKAA